MTEVTCSTRTTISIFYFKELELLKYWILKKEKPLILTFSYNCSENLLKMVSPSSSESLGIYLVLWSYPSLYDVREIFAADTAWNFVKHIYCRNIKLISLTFQHTSHLIILIGSTTILFSEVLIHGGLDAVMMGFIKKKFKCSTVYGPMMIS